MKRRVVIVAATLGGVAAAAGLVQLLRFPPDTTPEGAYLRIAASIARGAPAECFAYLEEDAQHAAFTIAGYVRQARARIATSYPKDVRARALATLAPWGDATDGPAIWVTMAAKRRYVDRLRRDLSGVAEVQRSGERATITTARGTRYSFRRRPNGIWGLTLFSAEMVAEAERLARDWGEIKRAADDYDAAGR